MTTENSYTLTQLAQIVSALEGERRNPNSKATALRAIERNAAQIGLSAQDVLAAADGLFSGRLSDAEWRAQLGDESVESHAEEAVPEAAGTGGDSRAAVETAPEGDEPLASIDMPHRAAATSALPVPADARAPSVKQQLLAACQAAERWLQAQHNRPDEPDEILEMLRAAIERAEGRPRQGGEPGKPRQPRADTKEAQVIALLRRPQGVTLAQIGERTGWQTHTIRGFFAGALKKRRGMQVTSEKTGDGERLYRLADGC